MWIKSFKNYEVAQMKDGKKCEAEFLEIIVFVREDACWLIDRYHAVVVQSWKCIFGYSSKIEQGGRHFKSVDHLENELMVKAHFFALSSRT